MWILRNVTEDHGSGEGKKKKEVREGGSQNKRLSKTENKLRVDGVGKEGRVGDGY